jgi:transposase, IS30 family
MPPRVPTVSAFRLSLAEREEISRGLVAGDSYRAIAARLGRAPSTISREVSGRAARQQYRAWRADATAIRRRARPKVCKLRSSERLRAVVESGLAQRWSPQQIVARLVLDHPTDESLRVSHETIYRALYIPQHRALPPRLASGLRSGRTKRRPRGRLSRNGQIKHMLSIHERPFAVEERVEPGHWEGDLVLGKLGRSAIGTLVERHTRFLRLVRLPVGRSASLVKEALINNFETVSATLKRSLTWDQGKEMGAHRAFTTATSIPVYFCDPRSPWQRATNENTNGLLRQYLPKGIDLSLVTRTQLDQIELALNSRPRKVLGWRSPAEALANIVALTD